MNTLNARAWFSLAGLAALMGLLLFLPAGTLRYWQGWLYLTVFLAASGAITRDLMKRDPALLQRRMRGGPTAEKSGTQKIIMAFTSIGFVGLLVVPALDRRFGWSEVPGWVSLAADFLTVLGFYVVFLVFKENSFAASTIEIAADQRVISTGPYAILRHPMYAGSLLYLVATPLALGSWWGLLVLPVFMPFLIWRLFDEERLLATDLPGYSAYCRRVRWRLIPWVF